MVLLALVRLVSIIMTHLSLSNVSRFVGKTHRIKSRHTDSDLFCISINDQLDLSSLISSFLSLQSDSADHQPLLYWNVSSHAPFEQLNRTLFSLFVCGSLNDSSSGLTFSSPIRHPWKYVVEVPSFNRRDTTTSQRNFEMLLPVLAMVAPKSLEEVNNANYQLFIGEEEELVARFLKAYENGTIDRLLTFDRINGEQPVHFDPLTDHNESRGCIYRCIEEYFPALPRNKICELSFTKFLYRRVKFFTHTFYTLNMINPHLGSTVMEQMIEEAKCLTRVDFSSDDYPRIYLVYDSGFSLHLLYQVWAAVPRNIKSLLNDNDPEIRTRYEGKNRFIECLAWLIDIQYDVFQRIMHENKFILTENFTYKLFHIHERKLTQLALIIEGETGVGKTFLLKFYASLLNANISHGQMQSNTVPRISDRISLWLLKTVIEDISETHEDLLNSCLRRLRTKLGDLSEVDEEEENTGPMLMFDDKDETEDDNESDLLTDMKRSLRNYDYDQATLRSIWKTIITTVDESDEDITKTLIVALHHFVTTQLIDLPLVEASGQLQKLLEDNKMPSVQKSIEIFDEFLLHTRVKPVFYRLLLHPGITEENVQEFMSPICELASRLPTIELLVFFDEVNTSSCLGLFKEMFMDGTLHGKSLPKNIFFTAAINPSSTDRPDSVQVHRRDYVVHQLPQALENLKVSYGILDRKTLTDYIQQKIATFTVGINDNGRKQVPLEQYAQDTLTRSILNAQDFCEARLGTCLYLTRRRLLICFLFIIAGHNSVSQREIQRCFNLIESFWKLNQNEEPDVMRCIALSLALIYYFRLPAREDNQQRKDDKTPSREELGELLSRTIPDFEKTIQDELMNFVNTDNFDIPQGVAVNQAVSFLTILCSREISELVFRFVNIYFRSSSALSLEHHCASSVHQVGLMLSFNLLTLMLDLGQSKTLSFQIVLQNLRGSELSTTDFCKRLPAIDPFFCLGSKYSRSEDIAYVFDRAIKREQQYQQNRIDTRCVKSNSLLR